MGLDQYAYLKTPESGDEGESPKFVWRKHSKLQTFMETLYTERNCLKTACQIGRSRKSSQRIIYVDDVDTVVCRFTDVPLAQLRRRRKLSFKRRALQEFGKTEVT